MTAILRPSTPAGDLIAHILERFHATHRRELPELVALAREVEQRHADHPAAPHGLGDALALLQIDLEAHMRKEETELFPALLDGRRQGLAATAGAVRHDHDFQDESLALIRELAHYFHLPADACVSWRELYAGISKLIGDLDEHMRLENHEILAELAAAA
ncbi:hemerythrin domain-containing protein [Aestuariivirga sp.]|uniref:hemerythrin domain-containing protein n=1 Tax=Aestuariivirga sp. TaxID=2650926 RepID=UPI00391D0EA5